MKKFEKVYQDIDRINKLDKKTLQDRFMKFNEEFGELSAEAIKLIGLTYKPFDKEHCKEEMADALQCLLSLCVDICSAADFSIDDVLDAMLVKNKKWEDKIKEYTANQK